MNRLLLSLVPLTDRPTSYLTRKPAARGPRDHRSESLPRRTFGARAARFSLGVGIASALLIGAARNSNAADIAVFPNMTVKNVVDIQPAGDYTPSYGILLPGSAQADSNTSTRDSVDITSIGVPSNPTLLTATPGAIHSRPSNGLIAFGSDRSADNSPLSDPAQGPNRSRSPVPIVWLDMRPFALSPANGPADAAPVAPTASISAPPDPAKADVYSKSGRNASREAAPDAIPGPSKLIGALLACALMLRRPRRYAGC